MQAMGRDGERQTKLHSLAPRAPPAVTTQLLTGRGPLLVHGLGAGDLWYRG